MQRRIAHHFDRVFPAQTVAEGIQPRRNKIYSQKPRPIRCASRYAGNMVAHVRNLDVTVDLPSHDGLWFVGGDSRKLRATPQKPNIRCYWKAYTLGRTSRMRRALRSSDALRRDRNMHSLGTSMRWALHTTRSRMESAMVGSPICEW